MSSFSRLDLKWRAFVDVVTVCIPAFETRILAFALTIPESEDVKLDRCVWLDGTGLVSQKSCGCSRVIPVDSRGVEGIAFDLLQGTY